MKNKNQKVDNTVSETSITFPPEACQSGFDLAHPTDALKVIRDRIAHDDGANAIEQSQPAGGVE